MLEGEPEHRDGVLTKAEKIANQTMMVCVSGCKGSRLVLRPLIPGYSRIAFGPAFVTPVFCLGIEPGQGWNSVPGGTKSVTVIFLRTRFGRFRYLAKSLFRG
ncbi:hypothetical protein X922_16320 [Pseudomonas aeruginosa VRFPA08]|nr:hypothetical protein X922_16320 [Pseudomonas aeruginosa VRFPA08]